MTTEHAKNNPWAICRAQVGADQTKFESCVLDLKKKMGLHAEMSEAQYMAEDPATKTGPKGSVFQPFTITPPTSMELGLGEDGGKYYSFTSSAMDSSGKFKGGFEGCVLHFERSKNLSKDHARKLCAYIGRRAGKLSEAERVDIMNFGELSAEIFEEGVHGGVPFTASDMLELKQNFDQWGRDTIKPPLVLGHDEKQPLIQNMGLPSLGWLRSVELKTKPSGKMVAIGHFSEVPEVARQAIQKGLYKRISSEIYANYMNPNMDGGKAKGKMFRRVSLMGADIPEVKTLADVVAFGETKDPLIFVEREGESDMSMEAVKELEAKIAKMGEDQAKTAKALEALTAENATLKKANADLSADFAKTVVKDRQTAISMFIEAQKTAGKILPAWEEKGLAKFMESLDSVKVMKFSEKEGAAEVSPMAFFQDFIKSMPNVVRLGEMTEVDLEKIAAEKAEDRGGDGSKVNTKLAAAVAKHMEDSRKGGRVLTYGEALREVSLSQPELVAKLK